MGLILQVLGAVFLLILAYVAFRVVVLVGKVGLILFAVRKLVSHVEGSASPATIRLVPVAGASWDDAVAAGLASPLPDLGYREVGFFELDLMGGIRLQAWVHPGLGTYSVVYRNAQVGTWSDVVTKYEDGTSLTYSNSGHGGKLRQRAGFENVYFPGLGTAEMHRKMIAERPDRPTRHLATTDFAGDFERAYADETAWRASPEGFDPQAVNPLQAMVGMMRKQFTPDQQQQIRDAMTSRGYEWIAGPLRQAYRDRAQLPDAAWAELEPRLLFVWDTIGVDMLRAALPEWRGLPDWDRLEPEPVEGPDEAGDVPERRLRRPFADLNAGLPPELRLTKVGEARVDEVDGVALDDVGGDALEADVYERPRPAGGRSLPGPSAIV